MAEKILGPALLSPEGEIMWLEAPLRHSDVMKRMQEQGIDPRDVWNSSQGFWTNGNQYGRYVSREEAWDIAEKAGQLVRPELARRPRELFTECMW